LEGWILVIDNFNEGILFPFVASISNPVDDIPDIPQYNAIDGVEVDECG